MTRLLHVLGLDGLAGLGDGPFLERGFAAQFHTAFVVDADAFYPYHFAHLGHVFRAVHPEIRELGNMDETIPSWKHFDERAEFFDRATRP